MISNPLIYSSGNKNVGNVIVDWDPNYVEEEYEMLDLSEYTALGINSGNNNVIYNTASKVFIVKDKTTLIISAYKDAAFSLLAYNYNSNTGGLSHAYSDNRDIINLQILAGQYIKIILPTIYDDKSIYITNNNSSGNSFYFWYKYN